MSKEFKLPELGEGVHEGELIKWKVKPGDTVQFDQSLCEIMTDKATVEIPSAIQGKVEKLHAKEGEVVHVGQLMLTLEGSAETGKSAKAEAPAPAKAPEKPSAPAPMAAKAPAPAPAMSAAPSGGGGMSMARENLDIASRPLAAPSTRRMAREQGIDLTRVRGTGPHGRVMKEDLRGGSGALSAGFPRPSGTQSFKTGEERVPFRGLRKKIAEKMRLSKDHAAHFTYVEEADATALVALRNEAKAMGAAQGIKVTYLPFVMKAMVAALRQYPILNSSLDEEKQELVYKHYFNIGLSIQTEDGLTAPVVKDVENKSIFDLARDIQDLVDRARHKKLTTHDFEGSTITLTNAGSIGGLFATPIINYPEVAILGFNKIAKKPVVIGDQIQIRDWTLFSISLDHRVVDGAIGAEFMKLFIKYIENPGMHLLG